jgi:dihydrolipoamide dehydrogenase
MSHTYDVAIIGAGTAGLAALREVQRHTDNFVIVNDGAYGTTCARVGCMPSKALIETANAYHRREVFDEFGIRGAEALRVDVAATLARVRKLRDRFVADVIAITDELRDKSIAGHARFVEPDVLEVNGSRLSAKNIVIATGSRPIVPNDWRGFGARVLTSDTLFEQATLPQHIAVVGMGVIGVEVSQALARLGLSVSAFGAGHTVAGISDEPVAAALIALLHQEMSLTLGEPADLTAEDRRLRVAAGNTSVVVDAVFAALGRRPNVEDLGLDRLGIELDQDGVPLFDAATRQLGQLPIYIAGDVTNDFPVLHEAADDGYVAGINATSDAPVCFARRTFLNIVFCDPNVAVIGTPYAKLDLDSVAVGTVDFAMQGRATVAADNRGVLRVYAKREDGRLLGAELCAPRGEHLAHLLALAIDRRASVQDVLRMPFYHPVFEEGLRTALRDVTRQLGHPRASDLASCGAVGASALD